MQRRFLVAVSRVIEWISAGVLPAVAVLNQPPTDLTYVMSPHQRRFGSDAAQVMMTVQVGPVLRDGAGELPCVGFFDQAERANARAAFTALATVRETQPHAQQGAQDFHGYRLFWLGLLLRQKLSEIDSCWRSSQGYVIAEKARRALMGDYSKCYVGSPFCHLTRRDKRHERVTERRSRTPRHRACLHVAFTPRPLVSWLQLLVSPLSQLVVTFPLLPTPHPGRSLRPPMRPTPIRQ